MTALPNSVQRNPRYQKALKDMETDDLVQVVQNTICVLLDGPFPTLGMFEKALGNTHTPALVMLGNNDIHPMGIAETVHRLVLNCRWAEVQPHAGEPA